MATHLQEGEKAPVFTSKDQHGNNVSLADLKGQKIVLYFYPADDTPGCTKQACNLRDNHSALLKAGIKVIGISPDENDSHQAFTEKYSLPFPLIPDPKRIIIEKYGVWGEKNLYGKKFEGLLRTTFVIDEEGKILKIFRRPKTAEHADEILKAIEK